MHILHVMPSVSRSYGGPTQSLIGYAQAGRRAGLDLHVAAPRPPAPDEGWLREQLPEATFHFFRGVGSGAFAVAPGLFAWLYRCGRAFDAVHTHGLFNPTSSGAARLGAMRGWPLVIRPFGTLSRYTFSHQRARLKREYFRFVDRPSVRQAGGLHFTTAAERDEAARLDLNLGDRAFVVPPPFRGPYAQTEPKAPVPTALFLSRLHPKKNVSGLLSAWKRILGVHPDAQLIVAGRGPDDYENKLWQQSAALGLRDHVSFAGFVKGKEKQKLLASAHVFALPSHQENFGVAVLEAVAAGLPVVISPQVQLASFIERHELGRVAERDPVPLAEALAEALGRSSLRQRCAKVGPERVKEHFSPEAVSAQLRDLYAHVARS